MPVREPPPPFAGVQTCALEPPVHRVVERSPAPPTLAMEHRSHGRSPLPERSAVSLGLEAGEGRRAGGRGVVGDR
jgi:hypothetical protein